LNVTNYDFFCMLGIWSRKSS